MATLQEVIDHLQEEHDRHMRQAYDRLFDGADADEMAPLWAYAAGMLHAIRTIESEMRRY